MTKPERTCFTLLIIIILLIYVNTRPGLRPLLSHETFAPMLGAKGRSETASSQPRHPV